MLLLRLETTLPAASGASDADPSSAAWGRDGKVGRLGAGTLLLMKLDSLSQAASDIEG
jgi:hypothetical protein